MAHRHFFQFRLALEPSVVELWAVVSIGSSGAPTLVRGKGIKAITRTGTGEYTVALQDSYTSLLEASMVTKNSTGIPSVVMGIKNDHSNAAQPTIDIVTSASLSGTDAAPGDELHIRFTLRNSSI